MITKVKMILSFVWTLCWMVQNIDANPYEFLKERQSGTYGPPLTDDELNCIPTFSKTSFDPAIDNHTCIQHDNKNAYPALKWPNPTQIPYEIDSAFDSHARCVIGYAMKKYHSNTCIRFVAKTSETDFIQINRLDVPDFQCYTLGVGYTEGDGAHTVNFSPSCFDYQSGTAMHEMMHRLGFLHEHTRPDRDSYIDVIWSNITPDWKPQYEIAADSTLILQYDYSSVMHYYLGDAMTTKKNTRGVYVGQRKSLSKMDIMKLNVMYCKLP